MTTGSMIEVAVAVVLLVGGIWLYRRPKGPDGYGNQGAVILLVIAIILLIHGFGLLEYRPSAAELNQ
jgi:hypothetical protein